MQFPSSPPSFLTVTSKYVYPSATFYRRVHALSLLFPVVNDQCLKKLPNSLIPLNASIALYPQSKYHIQFTIAYMKFQFWLENLSFTEPLSRVMQPMLADTVFATIGRKQSHLGSGAPDATFAAAAVCVCVCVCVCVRVCACLCVGW